MTGRDVPRIVVYNRWASAVALTLATLIMIASMIMFVVTLQRLGQVADQLNNDLNTVDVPTPDVVPPGAGATGCPFGDDQCGG